MKITIQTILRRAVLHLLTREHDTHTIDAGDRAAYCLMLQVVDTL